MKRAKPIHIYCQVFRRNIYVFHQWTYDSYKSYLSINYSINSKDAESSNGCMQVIEKGDNNLILLWTKKTGDKLEGIDTLTHESVHVANEVFSHADIELSTRNDELQAYYISMIVRSTLKKGKP